MHYCSVSLEGFPLADAPADSTPTAKKLAADIVLKQLREVCWTVQRRIPEKEGGLSVEELLGEKAMKSETLSDNNIGNRLLKKMGWTGGGIGKDGKGIAEPIAAAGVVNRAGLGLSAEQGVSKQFMSCVKKIISDYLVSDNENDLIFAPDFSKEQRAMIHKECQKFGLKTQSYGKNEDRHLVASRRRTPQQLFNYLVKQGGETAKYILVAPGEHPDLKSTV